MEVVSFLHCYSLNKAFIFATARDFVAIFGGISTVHLALPHNLSNII